MNDRELGILEGKFSIIERMLQEVVSDTKENTQRLDRWNGSILAMEKRLDEDFVHIKESMVRIEVGLSNHLEHHEEIERIKGSRIFQLLGTVFHILLYAAVMYILVWRK